MKKTYFNHVEAQAHRNPCISTLVDFLSEKTHQKPCRIVSLDFYADAAAPVLHSINADELRSELLREKKPLRKSPLEDSVTDSSVGEVQDGVFNFLGCLLIIEDLNKDIIEVLGSCLDIDPLFFASHLHAPKGGMRIQPPDTVTLPSRSRHQTFTNIHYHRTVVFEQEVPSTKLFRDINIPRKVAVLPAIKNTHIALAQHCTSIYKPKRDQKDWIGIVLVDPPITSKYSFADKDKQTYHARLLPSQLFMEGYEDFLDPPSFFGPDRGRSGPGRYSLMEDIIYYWSIDQVPGFNMKTPSLLMLAYFPLKVVAAEWTSYVAVMSHSIKQYEYSSRDEPNFLQQLNKLNADLGALQSWRRRTMSSKQKIRSVIRLLSTYRALDGPTETWSGLLEDYEYLVDNVTECGGSLESMLPTVTSLVQIIDSRRSFAETANISRLTILALVFVPLTFISSIFSMNNNTAPGGSNFWIYFAVAIPVTLIVFLIARPPFSSRDVRRMFRVLRSRNRSYANDVSKEA